MEAGSQIATGVFPIALSGFSSDPTTRSFAATGGGEADH